MNSHDIWTQTDEEFDASMHRVVQNWAKTKEPSQDIRQQLILAAAAERVRHFKRPSVREMAIYWFIELLWNQKPGEGVFLDYDRTPVFPRFIVPVFEAEFGILRQVI
jgi:hypothetical protein